MFRIVPLSIIRSLFTVHSAMLYIIQVCRQLSSSTRSCTKAAYKPVWQIPLLSVQWINSWWWTEELSETCRVSCQNKFVELVHPVGFITKKCITVHGHTNVKFAITMYLCAWLSICHSEVSGNRRMTPRQWTFCAVSLYVRRNRPQLFIG